MLDFVANALVGVGVIGLMFVTAVTVIVCQLAKTGQLQALADLFRIAPSKPDNTNPN